MTLFRRLSLTALVASLIQITSGGIVRATGSGDACPDWPRCFGRWIPPMRADTLIEYTHRVMASIVMGLVLALVVVGLRRVKDRRALWVPAVLALGTVVVQALIGAAVVAAKGNGALPGPELVTFHIAVAVAFIGLVTLTTVNAYRAPAATPEHATDPITRRLGVATAVGVFALILIGAYVRAEGAALAFPDWPLMDGQLVPELFGLGVPHFIHRLAAVVVGVLVAAFAVRVARRHPGAPAALALTVGVLYLAQAVVGGLQVLTRLAVAPVVAHVALSSAIWASLIALLALLWPARVAAAAPEARAATKSRAGGATRIKAYVQLMKPRIILLLLVTTVPSMVLAERGLPSVWLMLATLIGGTLAAGSANTINCYIDRDIDEVMRRTRGRPLPMHQVSPTHALLFGIVLAVMSFAWLTLTVNRLSALLGLAAILFYVLVYTLALKRTTPQNIVIGGAAGAVPVLVGWAAVRGTVGVEALVMFAVIFFWTPPHFWALAMRHAADYAAAGVPMLPVVAGAKTTQRQILLYALITVATTLALVPAAGMGLIYLVSALLLGALFIRSAVALWRTGTQAAAMGLFRYSISYLALLFTAVGVDAAVWPVW